MAQITGNAEIQNIKQIMGLQHGKVRLVLLLAFHNQPGHQQVNAPSYARAVSLQLSTVF